MYRESAYELAEILERHDRWFNGEDGGERADLSDYDLSGMNLEGVNLAFANLSHANLAHANLFKARLMSSNLFQANLSFANLSESKLQNATLWFANFKKANLANSKLFETDLMHVNLSKAKLTNASLWNVVGNGREIKSLLGLEKHRVSYTSTDLQIRHVQHPIEEWKRLDEDKASSMEMDDEVFEFWTANKDFILEAINRCPATPTGWEE